MKRFHALEFEDLSWFPNSWRDYGTDYLRFVATRFDIYGHISPIIEKGLDASGQNCWIDCASGGGSGLINLAEKMKSNRPDLKIILTDYYPNIEAFELTKKTNETVFDYEKNCIDAKQVPQKFKGTFRTMFGSFHHFRPKDAQQILQNAVDQNAPIAIFEPVGRNFPSFFSMLFVILNVLIMTPFIRPVRWSVLPFIYLIPLIPLYILWDGIASIFRTYSEKEMKELISKLKNAHQFEWEIGKRKKGPIPMQYLIGIPANKK